MSLPFNAGAVSAIYDGFNSRDLDSVVDQVTEDFTLIDITTGQTVRGREGLRHWLQTWLTAAPDAMVEVMNVIAGGDWIATEHIGRGTHSGPLATPAGIIPPTGRRFEQQWAEIFQLRDGKVALMRAYADSATVLRQLGLL